MTAHTDQAQERAAPPTPADGRPALREQVAPFVAIGALVFFALLLTYVIMQIGLPQQQWDRIVFVISGVEAIAFAAAGYLFGREVNRQRAERAEERAEEAEEDAANGRTLATVTKNKASLAARPGGLEGSRPQGSADLRELAALAERLFPGA
jgi:hypothetical protein